MQLDEPGDNMILLAMLGCGSQLYVDHDQVGCVDYDFDNPGEEAIEIVQDGADLIISHTNLVQTCDAVFEPVLSSDGSTLEIREYWGEGSSDCEACLTPRVIISDAPGRKIEVRWYIGDDDIPLDVIEVKAE
ncbi:MAG: hypothetical protein ACI8RZ_001636 [Myxococcota bacterium]|jgi:hypothetical protein